MSGITLRRRNDHSHCSPIRPAALSSEEDGNEDVAVALETTSSSDEDPVVRGREKLKRGVTAWSGVPRSGSLKAVHASKQKVVDGTRKQPPRRCCSRTSRSSGREKSAADDDFRGSSQNTSQSSGICGRDVFENPTEDEVDDEGSESNPECEENNDGSSETSHGSSHGGLSRKRSRRFSYGSRDLDADQRASEQPSSSGTPFTGERRIDKIFACRWGAADPDLKARGSKKPTLEKDVHSEQDASNASEVSVEGGPSHQPLCDTALLRREMEYLVKFEGESYRRLRWLPRSRLSLQKNDQGDLKVTHFHRKMTGGSTDCEVPLTAQDEGNFLLYTQIDRIVAVRLCNLPATHRASFDQSAVSVNDATVKRRSVSGGRKGTGTVSSETVSRVGTSSGRAQEYLVKWKLLGYVDATWELESTLTSPEDKKQIVRFRRINTTFDFPVCIPAPGIVMAADGAQGPSPDVTCGDSLVPEPGSSQDGGCGRATAGRRNATDFRNVKESDNNVALSGCNKDDPTLCPVGVIRGETYRSDAVVKQEGATRLWQMFLKRKLGADGTYIPSLQMLDVQTGKSTQMPKEKAVPCSSDPSLPRRLLMAHQQEGLKWLFFNTEINRHGSLLADEMGLGKTCQSIAFLEHLLDVMSAGSTTGCHSLVVVQKSVFENWRREFQVWAPHLNVLPLCGGRRDREIARRYEVKWMCVETGKPVNPPSFNNGNARKLMKPDVVLVTYEGLRTTEFHQLTQSLSSPSTSRSQGGPQKFKWTCVIVDECQKVKGGRSSVLLQQLSQLKRHLMVLLTGTPIQNTTEELFPMLTLLHPTKFYYDEPKEHKKNNSGTCWSAARFSSSFSNIQDRDDCMQRTEELHELMAPYILRREKAHVLKTLPPKTVKLIKIPLTVAQKRVYSALYHRSIRTKGLKLSNVHMQLRKCCIHPFLIEGMEDLIFEGKITGDVVKQSSVSDEIVAQNDAASTDDKINTIDLSVPVDISKVSQGDVVSESNDDKAKRLFLESSGKFVLLKKMLESFYQARRKILIFSFFKSALDLIEDFISLCQYPWTIERVDGQTTGEERQLAIDRFNADENRFVFLCTTRAGGLGINLTAASVVIHLDSDFNPQHDLQAQARCHRIGQEKNVDVFHFIAEHTYEDYMLFTIAGKKLGLEAVLLGRLDATKGRLRLDKQQEEKVLRKGVFAAIRDDDAARREAAEFAESSIETILSTKSTTVTLDIDTKEEEVKEAEGELEVKLLERSGSARSLHPTFSAATFAVTTEGTEQLSIQTSAVEGLDEDQPDFWVKVAQRLGPWTVEEEKKPELTRADRRRGRALTYCPGMTYYDRDGVKRPRRDQRSNGRPMSAVDAQHGSDVETYDDGLMRDEDDGDDGISSVQSYSEDVSSDSDESDDLAAQVIMKDDLEIGGVSVSPSLSKKAVSSRGGGRSRIMKAGSRMAASGAHVSKPSGPDSVSDQQQKGLSQMNWTDWSKYTSNSTTSTNDLLSSSSVPVETVSASSAAEPPCAMHTSLDESSTTAAFSPVPLGSLDVVKNSFGLPGGPPGALLAMDLLYRCLRALRRWKTTRVGETGGLRTDDIRDADRCSPWALSTGSRRSVSAADQVLQQSWLETLQEWKRAGDDWESKKNTVIDSYARKVLHSKREYMETQWLSYMRSTPLTDIKTKEELIYQMNTFFVSEARRLALSLYGDLIVKALQSYCDETVPEVLTGKHFSREFTIKKQTWIGAEDFCIKLVFIHLMARRYAPPNIPPPRVSVMRWPPPQLETNWALTTEVIKKLNQYTGGPERRRAAIHERFYNKLDSRWNHEEFTQEERDILAIASANGLAAHIVAEEMPGRSLERVKKGLKCPYVLREAQRQNLLIQQPVTPFANEENGSPSSSGIVVNVISRFRSICREKGILGSDDPQYNVENSRNARDSPKAFREPAEYQHPVGGSAPLLPPSGHGSARLPSFSAQRPEMSSAIPIAVHREEPLSVHVADGSLPFTSSFGLETVSHSDVASSGRSFTRPPAVVTSYRPEFPPVSLISQNDILDSIAIVLSKIGVPASDFENLRGSLMSQPVSRLADLLERLENVHRKYATPSPPAVSTNTSSSSNVARVVSAHPPNQTSSVYGLSSSSSVISSSSEHPVSLPTVQSTKSSHPSPSFMTKAANSITSGISMSSPATTAPTSSYLPTGHSSVRQVTVSGGRMPSPVDSSITTPSPAGPLTSALTPELPLRQNSSSLTAAASALSASLQAVRHLPQIVCVDDDEEEEEPQPGGNCYAITHTHTMGHKPGYAGSLGGLGVPAPSTAVDGTGSVEIGNSSGRHLLSRMDEDAPYRGSVATRSSSTDGRAETSVVVSSGTPYHSREAPVTDIHHQLNKREQELLVSRSPNNVVALRRPLDNTHQDTVSCDSSDQPYQNNRTSLADVSSSVLASTLPTQLEDLSNSLLTRPTGELVSSDSSTPPQQAPNTSLRLSIADIHRRMQTDSVFAARVIEYIGRLQNCNYPKLSSPKRSACSKK